MSLPGNPIPPVTDPYGRDLATYQTADGIDLDPAMTEATGRAVLSQSLVRRQTTPHGSVIDRPNDCVDVRQLMGEGVTQGSVSAFVADLTKELQKDERVKSVDVSATYDVAHSTLTIVENIASLYGPFSLTLTVDKVSVKVLNGGT